MFVLANFIFAAANILDVLLTVLYWFVIVRALLSWVNPDPNNPIVQFLYKTTEPILGPVRRRLPLAFRFGIDISPIIVFLSIMFLKSFVVRSLFDLGMRLKAGY
ncbi:MAG: YggT family protein [Candidatus Omnitrophica bacterium]|nr:YggT family protein [Candidatus Omnitrophota bacterium]MDD5661400.1 YggT family protein [Candidatus Omnitrophota bacterium]